MRALRGGYRVLAAAGVVVLLASAALGHKLVTKHHGVVTLDQNKVVQISSNMYELKGYVALRNAEIEYRCPSGYDLQSFVSVDGPHEQYRISVPAKVGKHRVHRQTYPRIRVAKVQELVDSCLAGKRRFKTSFKAKTSCYKPGLPHESDVKTAGSNIAVNMKLNCRNIIPADQRFARVTVKSYRHECPAGYVMKTGKMIARLPTKARQTCVRR